MKISLKFLKNFNNNLLDSEKFKIFQIKAIIQLNIVLLTFSQDRNLNFKLKNRYKFQKFRLLLKRMKLKSIIL